MELETGIKILTINSPEQRNQQTEMTEIPETNCYLNVKQAQQDSPSNVR